MRPQWGTHPQKLQSSPTGAACGYYIQHSNLIDIICVATITDTIILTIIIILCYLIYSLNFTYLFIYPLFKEKKVLTEEQNVGNM